MKLILSLFNEDKGVTLIEYALIAILIAIALIATLDTSGQTIVNFYQSVADAFP